MKRLTAILALVLLLLSLADVSTAQATISPPKFAWHVSDAFIQNVADPANKQTGAVAHASSGALAGDVIRVSGSGSLNTAAMTATGSGTFVHTSSAGQVKGFGTWSATGLQSFTLYGCDGGPFPPNFCGGLAVLRIHTTGTSTSTSIGQVEHNATISINCKIGGGPGAEGITLNIPGLVNFDVTDASLHGETLFVSPNPNGP
jgi:hypothetical protein